MLDSGENLIGLAPETPPFADPFNDSNPHHILETDVVCSGWDDQLSEAAAFNCSILQDFDLFEDAKDMSFTPVGVIDHRISTISVRTTPASPGEPPSVSKQRQLRAKVVWRTGRSHGQMRRLCSCNTRTCLFSVHAPIISLTILTSSGQLPTP